MVELKKSLGRRATFSPLLPVLPPAPYPKCYCFSQTDASQPAERPRRGFHPRFPSPFLSPSGKRIGDVCISPPFLLISVVSFPSWPRRKTRDSSKGLSLSSPPGFGDREEWDHSSLLLSGLLNPSQTCLSLSYDPVWVKQKVAHFCFISQNSTDV